jgi:hypothetical protein
MAEVEARPLDTDRQREFAGTNGIQREIKREAAICLAEGSPTRLLPSWGGPLSEIDYATLASSWITRDIADVAMLRRVDAHEGREVIGQKGNRDCAGMLIPYYWPGEPGPFNYRVRRDKPEYRFGKRRKAEARREIPRAAQRRESTLCPTGHHAAAA